MRLSYIAATEKITIDSKVIDALITTSSGDLRRAITYLQSASRLSSSTNPSTPILPSDIQEIAGVVPDLVINDFARVIGVDIEDEMDIDLPQHKQGGFEPIKNKVKFLMREGYSATQILFQVCFYVLFLNNSHLFSISYMTLLFFIRLSAAGRSLHAPWYLQRLIKRCVMVLTRNCGSWRLGSAFTKLLHRDLGESIFLAICSMHLNSPTLHF
jgi:hypothetical protein